MNDLSEAITLRARIEELEREKIDAEASLRAVTEALGRIRRGDYDNAHDCKAAARIAAAALDAARAQATQEGDAK